MSRAFFAHATQGEHSSQSAGTQPTTEVNPVVVEAMSEVGIDIAGKRPQKLSMQMTEWADVVVTMGCGDGCPLIPGKRYIDWDLADPAGLDLEQVRQIRDQIED